LSLWEEEEIPLPGKTRRCENHQGRKIAEETEPKTVKMMQGRDAHIMYNIHFGEGIQ
jgi:hypothetical protein